MHTQILTQLKADLGADWAKWETILRDAAEIAANALEADTEYKRKELTMALESVLASADAYVRNKMRNVVNETVSAGLKMVLKAI
jgi:vacuolar-type H+-ATPase subunit E/Vma4